MTKNKPDFQTIASPLRANLKRALEALDAYESSSFSDEADLGALAKATYLAGLGARGLAALSIPDEDFGFARGSHVILNNEA